MVVRVLLLVLMQTMLEVHLKTVEIVAADYIKVVVHNY